MVKIIFNKKAEIYLDNSNISLRLYPEKVLIYFLNMKGAYFFTILLVGLFCFTSNAQDATNNNSPSHITPEKAIKSMLPPQLSYPANESVIDIQYPVLIWIPPRPISGMMVIYSLRLVEIMKGQTLAEALLQNPPLLDLNGLTNTFLNYPVTATPLRVDGHYAWQVAASYAGQSLGVTDIWSFTIKKDNHKTDPDINYPVVAKVSRERFYITHGVIHFVYNNTTNEKTLSYTIKSMDRSMKSISKLPVLKLNPGMNKLQVDLKESGILKSNTYYNLEIKDIRQQVYKLTYYYIPS
jgi:hypothetical protein